MMAPKDIIAPGALKLDQFSPSTAAPHLLRQAFSDAISTLWMTCATVAISLAVLTKVDMQRPKLRKVSQDCEAASGNDPVEHWMIILDHLK